MNAHTTDRISIGDMLLRDIVEQYPASMSVLDEYGMDMCCGGGHTLHDAARLHGFEPEVVVAKVQDAIQHGSN